MTRQALAPQALRVLRQGVDTQDGYCYNRRTMYTTTFHIPEQQKREWFLIDAKDRILGRLATRIAMLLRGKHKPAYTPFFDTGDFVVLVNAKQIRVTGNKRSEKTYSHYSGYPGGHKLETFEDVIEKQPERIIREAVKGMLPAGPLGRAMLTKLKIYAGPKHNNAAQNPIPAPERIIGAVHGA